MDFCVVFWPFGNKTFLKIIKYFKKTPRTLSLKLKGLKANNLIKIWNLMDSTVNALKTANIYSHLPRKIEH